VDLGLRNKNALVFGAGGGLGGAIARTLAHEGANVVVSDRDGDAAETTARSIRSGGGAAHQLKWDLGDLSVIKSNISDIERELGTIDVLVNNTGGPPPTPVAAQDPQ
jgi:3-oxoacyl-[acyl-carrier protein] reductase